MKFGAILVLELVTKRQELFDIHMGDKYNILHKGKIIYSNLSEEEYFDIMEDLSVEYYQTDSPNPNDLTTEIIIEE